MLTEGRAGSATGERTERSPHAGQGRGRVGHGTEHGRNRAESSIKELVGQPPADYLAEWRVTVAQGRLRAGASVAHTAAELGYANPPAFSRAFAQRVGHSPRARLTADAAATP
ncbi:helix-turn-helix domain-containing protein [Streptomyces sp. NPDC056257]|uniref:helix-turn-helix domain-containing protein n=1 Tax=Streptomyces sp. NPDC056257 TaxID=3345765 RepID=UPI0035D563F6